jgi:hypothetical protein
MCCARGGRLTVGSQADGFHPTVLRDVQTVEVEKASLTHFKLGPSAWINQADCIDMDCDGVITCRC